MLILNKGNLIGCVYIESYQKIFSSRHERSLQALTHQIGVPITNVRLFNSLQSAMEKNAMIESQQIALNDVMESKEAAIKATRAKSNLLATISHELPTPFAGFSVMIRSCRKPD
jgi:signal transduction histidine kinase